MTSQQQVQRMEDNRRMLKLKCTEFDFGWGTQGLLQRSPRPSIQLDFRGLGYF